MSIQKISYTHDAMIDLIVAHPGISNNELAARFGYTAAWCSMIKSSDAFKARLAARRTELVDPTITATLEDRIRAVTERSLEVIAEKLEAPAAFIPDALVMRAAEFGAKSLGIGQTPPAPAANPNHLEELAERLVALQSKHRRVQNAEDVRFVESQAQEARVPAGDPAVVDVEGATQPAVCRGGYAVPAHRVPADSDAV